MAPVRLSSGPHSPRLSLVACHEFIPCPSTRHMGTQFLAQGHSPLLVPLVFRIMACHEQIKFSFQLRILCVEWRRERDSNPRSAKRTIAFEATAFNHSAISPGNSCSFLIYQIPSGENEERTCQPVFVLRTTTRQPSLLIQKWPAEPKLPPGAKAGGERGIRTLDTPFGHILA